MAATNSAIDALAAAFPAPAGPLTRVTDIDAINILEKDDLDITFTTDATSPALGTVYTVTLSYNQLRREDSAVQLVLEQIGVNAFVYSLIARIETIRTAAQALTEPYTEANYKTLMYLLRTNLKEVRFW
jgi:hypothetical protein